MSQRNRANLSKKVGADFFQSDKGIKAVKESKQQNGLTEQQKFKSTFYMSPDIHKKLRIECAEKGVRISTFIEELLANYFDSKTS